MRSERPCPWFGFGFGLDFGDDVVEIMEVQVSTKMAGKLMS